MTKAEIFKKAHCNAAAWMAKQDKYKSMYSYPTYAECFSSCLRSVYIGLREEKEVPVFYSTNPDRLQAARMTD